MIYFMDPNTQPWILHKIKCRNFVYGFLFNEHRTLFLFKLMFPWFLWLDQGCESDSFAGQDQSFKIYIEPVPYRLVVLVS